AFLQRKKLRPAAVFILRRQQVVEAALKSGAHRRLAGGRVNEGEVAQLGGRGPVVDGRRTSGRLEREVVRRRRLGHVGVLGPAALRRLVEQDGCRHRPGLVGGIPRRRLFQHVVPARRRQQGRRQAQREQDREIPEPVHVTS